MRGSQVAQLVKNSVRKTRVRSLGWEDPLEKGEPTHSRTLAWILQGLSMESQRVGPTERLFPSFWRCDVCET